MKRALAGLFCLALIACAPPTQFLKKSYAPAALEDKRLVVYHVFAGQIEIENQEDFADDFEDVTADPGVFFSKEITDKAGAYFQTGFKRVQVVSGGDSTLAALTSGNSEKITDKINKEDFEIRIPKSQYLESENLKPKFVLVLDQMIFSRNLEMSQSHMAAAPTMNASGKMVGGAPMSVTTAKKSISFGVNYLVYDYEEKAVVGYGFAKGEKTFSFAMTRSDWYKAMDDAFGKIKAFTPFK